MKTRSDFNCIGLSKVGDTALDLPEANVIIQINSQFGARRQEAQRLGRILRPKANQVAGSFNAFFYSLISTDTREMYFGSKRQQYLIDQGYTFQVLQNLSVVANKNSVLMKTKEDELNLLSAALSKDWSSAEEAETVAVQRNIDGDAEDVYGPPTGGGGDGGGGFAASAAGAGTGYGEETAVRHTGSSLSARSGADGTVYREFTAGPKRG